MITSPFEFANHGSSAHHIFQDAAVAVIAALNVTEPSQTGIGGDMFCLFYNAKTKKVHALNGSGRSAGKVSLEQLCNDLGLADKGQNGDKIPWRSVHAVTVPGAAAGWVDAVEKFGSGKISLDKILAPAIELAETGFPVSELSSYYVSYSYMIKTFQTDPSSQWQASESLLKDASPNGAEMLKKVASAADGCRAPKPGEIMKNPTLANTFKLLAKDGKKGFYEGPIAEAIIKVTSDLGARLTLEDLKNHGEVGTEEVDAITLHYTGQGVNKDFDGVKLWEHPPNGQGIVALMALGILEQIENAGKIGKWGEKDHNSVE
jgi:gamma-glutamyltranspeptidase/glutathione hydrolase